MTSQTTATVSGEDAVRGPVVARARWAITGVFFVNGLLIATYLVRIPSLRVGLGLTEPQLAGVLTCFSVAALLAMQSVGALVARFGSVRVIRVTLAALPFALAGIGAAGDVTQLAAAVTLAGAVHGILDVAMSSHAVAVERLLGRPIMNGCHAAWGTSSIIASLTGAAAAGIPVWVHTTGVAAVALPAGVVVGRWLLPTGTDRQTAGGTPRQTWRTGWTRPVLVFGSIGLVLMLCEAAVISWSGVFLHEDRGATLAVAAVGYGAFTSCQTLGRLGGDRLTERFGRVRVFRAHACVVVAGFAVVVLGPSQYVAIAGFAVLGYGTSVLVPLIFSTVGHIGGDGAATFVARVATFTYTGILTGPALVGWLGQGIGLTWTFAALIPLVGAVALGAGVLTTHAGPGQRG
ncbi:MFS transporter [Actinophytocola sp.]|uniref:MFS transporter n=1 Tax=Actinophytocola sp. TaxID=1872138 RepID=UPI0038998243